MEANSSPPIEALVIKRVQGIISALLYPVQAVNNKILMSISYIGYQKTSSLKFLVALVLDMSRTRTVLVPTVPFLGQCPVFMGTQDRLQIVSHGSVTCPLCPATQLWVKNNRASHGPK